MTEQTTIEEWPLNGREVFRVSLGEYNGRAVVDARVWFDDGTGRVKPGRKGVTLGVSSCPGWRAQWQRRMKKRKRANWWRAMPHAEAGKAKGERKLASSHDGGMTRKRRWRASP